MAEGDDFLAEAFGSFDRFRLAGFCDAVRRGDYEAQTPAAGRALVALSILVESWLMSELIGGGRAYAISAEKWRRAMADGSGMRGTTGPGTDGIGKALEAQFEVRSDRVRRGPTVPDMSLDEAGTVRRRGVPRDGNGNEGLP